MRGRRAAWAAAAIRIAIPIAIVVAGGACAGNERAKPMSREDANARKTIEELAHVSLPEDAVVTRWHAEQGIDGAIWARIEMPCARRDAFLLAAGYSTLSREKRAVENWHGPTASPGWFEPDDVSPFVSGTKRREIGRPRYAGHVLAGAGNEATCTVYLFVTSI